MMNVTSRYDFLMKSLSNDDLVCECFRLGAGTLQVTWSVTKRHQLRAAQQEVYERYRETKVLRGDRNQD